MIINIHIKDLDQFPYPDRQSLPIDYIESMPLDVPAVLSLERFCTMQTSRGCPYKCVYCDIPALADGKWRCRSPEHVLGEMQQLSDEGYRVWAEALEELLGEVQRSGVRP